jgi:hypothetical protein
MIILDNTLTRIKGKGTINASEVWAKIVGSLNVTQCSLFPDDLDIKARYCIASGLVIIEN